MIFDQVRDLGYETHNSIFNLGSLAVFLVFFLVRLLMWMLLKLYEYIFKKRVRYTKTLKHELFFSYPILLFTEAYFEWLISGILQLQTIWLTTNGEILGQVFGGFGLLVCLVVMPYLFIRAIKFPVKVYTRDGFVKKWSSFFIGVNMKTKG